MLGDLGIVAIALVIIAGPFFVLARNWMDDRSSAVEFDEGRPKCGSLCGVEDAGTAWARDQEIDDPVECIPIDVPRDQNPSAFERGCRRYVLLNPSH